jgi:outer membrane protein assembly factor BamA
VSGSFKKKHTLNMRIFMMCTIITLCNIPYAAAQKDSTGRNVFFGLLPLAYYTPETRIAFELVAYKSFKNDGAERLSNVRFFATYTQNDQYLFILPWQVFTRNESYFLSGSIDVRRFPEYFYGLGNNTLENNRELYSFDAVTVESRNLKKSSDNTYSGFILRYQKLETVISNTLLQNQSIIGSSGYAFFSLGWNLIFDERDHILNPQKGRYVDFFLMGSGYTTDHTNNAFSMLQLDYRQYFPLSGNATLAIQGLSQFTLGNVPFRALPTLGGPYLHRGYYMGRFRDNQLLLLQAAYRKHLFWRLGTSIFGSAGQVSSNVQNIYKQRVHLAGGAGLRVRISKKENTNVRIDYSFGRDSRGLYIYFAEAF